MSYDVMVSVKKQEGAKFDDVTKLNLDLYNSEAGELIYRLHSDYYDIVKFDNDVLKFVDADEIGYMKRRGATLAQIDAECYSETANVWACWGIKSSKILAKHLVSGMMVLQFSGEDGETWFHKIEPNKASKVEPKF